MAILFLVSAVQVGIWLAKGYYLKEILQFTKKRGERGEKKRFMFVRRTTNLQICFTKTIRYTSAKKYSKNTSQQNRFTVSI